MKTAVPGIIELECGWVVAVGCIWPNRVRLVLQFDPCAELPSHGVKTLVLSSIEAAEVGGALADAIERSVRKEGPFDLESPTAAR